MAVLHQRDGATVPAVAIERTPWGQQEQADSLRLVSCSDTGKACYPLTCMASGFQLTAQSALLQQSSLCCLSAEH